MGRHLWEESRPSSAVQPPPDDHQSADLDEHTPVLFTTGSRFAGLRDRLSALFRVAPHQGDEPRGVDIAWRVKRGAVLCLLVGALLWIGVSLWIRPLPQAQDLGSIKRDDPPIVSDAPEDQASAATAATATATASSKTSATTNASASENASASAPGSSSGSGSTVTVSVQGSVKHPGLYTVASGERWGMVLTKAGGVLKDADIRSINLAEQAQDGQQLYVPKVNETVPPAAAPATGSPAHVPGAPAAADATVGATRQVTSTVVNINLATAAELEALPGVGPALSQRIVEFREQNGPFKSAAELDAVSGIGPAMLKKLEGLIGF